MNTTVISGRLVRNPGYNEVENEKGLHKIAKFVLAVRRNYSDEVSFIPVKAFAKKAEFARDYLMQGTKVMVEGEIVTGNYEDKDMDENFVDCGVNIPGELQIGGGSLAKGYINDEELTMKKFITDVKGERWYRTGDRGMRWADGTIEFLGRMDTQVKIRGHRIELGEIESVLKSFLGIKEAVVVAQGDKYHKELVAFYLGEYIAENEIEGYLKLHLPEYSIPNSIIRLENFPLNANGKVDRKSLAEYKKIDSVEIIPDKALNIVLTIWEELLGNKVIDLDENLFKMGADSLLAARFVGAMNTRCGIEVHMKEVFMNPSINALTKLVDTRKKTGITELVEEGEI